MVYGEGVEPCMCVCLQVWWVNGVWGGCRGLSMLSVVWTVHGGPCDPLVELLLALLHCQ